MLTAHAGGIERYPNRMSQDHPVPYWSVEHEPLYPRLQSPLFSSTPTEFYSDGTRYPENMQEYDYFLILILVVLLLLLPAQPVLPEVLVLLAPRSKFWLFVF